MHYKKSSSVTMRIFILAFFLIVFVSASDALRCRRKYCNYKGRCYVVIKGTECKKKCFCFKDYTGDRCQYRCPRKFCRFRGKCVMVPGKNGMEKACVCRPNYVGKRCEHRCPKSYCLNGGTCTVVGRRTTKCLCPENYNGNRCQFLIIKTTNTNVVVTPKPPVCPPKFCKNGGTCKINGQKRRCKCTKNCIGRRCRRCCRPRDCRNGGTCYFQRRRKRCKCTKNCMGRRCEHCCRQNYCKNGGTCTISAKGGQVHMKCECPPGFDGKFCQQSIETTTNTNIVNTPPRPPGCPPDYCKNGGTCYHIGATNRCSCPKRCMGPHCRICCPKNYCKNHGHCIIFRERGHVKLRCECFKPYFGKRCQRSIETTTNTNIVVTPARPSVCPPYYCKNGGTCLTDGQNKMCKCTDNCIGRRCQFCCFRKFCNNNGRCYISGNTRKRRLCDCDKGFSGDRCKDAVETTTNTNIVVTPTKPPGCSRKFCNNNGRCYISGKGRKRRLCDCDKGFYGRRCQHVCPPDYCKNGGTYVGGKTEKCKCTQNCIGKRCQFCCSSQFCNNNGQCFIYRKRKPYQRRCKCDKGFYGRRCRNAIKSTTNTNIVVTPNPPPVCPPMFCKNGGTCILDGNKKRCKCTRNCTNKRCGRCCRRNYCRNGGTCYFQGKRAQCICTKNCTGRRCRRCCPQNFCKNGGTCLAARNGRRIYWRCICPKGFYGKCCHRSIKITTNTNIVVTPNPPPVCPPMFCKNGGTCILDGNKKRCKCTRNCTNKRCGRCCPRNYCRNGGTCFFQGKRARCICTKNCTGRRCRRCCPQNFCKNGGTCLAARNGRRIYWRCICPKGFYGKCCHRSIEITTNTNIVVTPKPPACSRNYCNNNGDCILVRAGRFLRKRCICKDYTGKRCEHYCPRKHCNYRGKCIVVRRGRRLRKRCRCNKRYAGLRCQRVRRRKYRP